MSDKNISVITPYISETNTNLHIAYTDRHNTKTSVVKYANDNNYVIINKDGSVPDIILDETTVNLIVKANENNRIMKAIIEHIKRSEIYDKAILNDKKVMTDLLHAYTEAPFNKSVYAKINDIVIAESIETVLKHNKDAQKYKK